MKLNIEQYLNKEYELQRKFMLSFIRESINMRVYYRLMDIRFILKAL